jgi:hypothetical protein
LVIALQLVGAGSGRGQSPPGHDQVLVAAVTPTEALVAGKPLLISLIENGTTLTEPRLVVDGDVKGGRYVSGVYDLVVGQGAPAS